MFSNWHLQSTTGLLTSTNIVDDKGTCKMSTAIICQGRPIGTFISGARISRVSFGFLSISPFPAILFWHLLPCLPTQCSLFPDVPSLGHHCSFVGLPLKARWDNRNYYSVMDAWDLVNTADRQCHLPKQGGKLAISSQLCELHCLKTTGLIARGYVNNEKTTYSFWLIQLWMCQQVLKSWLKSLWQPSCKC